MKYKTTDYFNYTRERPDRAFIKGNWIEFVIENAVHQEVQSDGRIRRWASTEEAERWLDENRSDFLIYGLAQYSLLKPATDGGCGLNRFRLSYALGWINGIRILFS